MSGMNLFLLATHIFWETIRHRKKIFLSVFLLIFAITAFVIRKLPKRYQSTALFNFHSDFSKVPASSEFYSEMYDPNEIRAEKEAILLGVLSDDFLFETAEKYLGSDAANHEWLVQGLRKDIRFVPLSRTTYQLVVIQRSPDDAEKIAWDVVEQLEQNLRSERLIRMQAVYESITQQLNELTIGEQDKNVAVQWDAARLKIENEIHKLESLYTAEHPRLIRLRAQLQNLRGAKQMNNTGPLAKGHLENWASLRGILITRQALLQVAIRMEEKGSISHIKLVKEPDHPLWPVEPKKKLLLVSAAITSTVVAAAVSACCSVASDIHALVPQLKESWKRFRSAIAERKKNTSDREDS